MNTVVVLLSHILSVAFSSFILSCDGYYKGGLNPSDERKFAELLLIVRTSYEDDQMKPDCYIYPKISKNYLYSYLVRVFISTTYVSRNILFSFLGLTFFDYV